MNLDDFKREKEIQDDLQEFLSRPYISEGKIKRVEKKDLIEFLKKDDDNLDLEDVDLEDTEVDDDPTEETIPDELSIEDIEIEDDNTEELIDEDPNSLYDKNVEDPLVYNADNFMDDYETPTEPVISENQRPHFLVAGGGGENNSIVSIGNGISVYKDKVGPDLRIKSISGTGNVSVTESDNLVIIQGNESNSVSGDYYDYNANLSANATYKEGRVFYDNTNKTIAVYGDQSDVTLQVGQENHIRVYNNTGSTITNGTPVDILSAISGVPLVTPAIAKINEGGTIGVATHNISTGSFGFVTNLGTVSDIDTSTFNIGDSLFLSNLSAGVMTNVSPNSPYDSIQVGFVVTVGSTDGKMLVKIDRDPTISPIEKVIYVSTSGSDLSAVDGTILKPYQTIKYALSTITDNDINNRYAILVIPGNYNEDNPIVTKEYVTINGIGGFENTRINALNEDILISGNNNTNISNLTFIGKNSPVIQMDVSNGHLFADNVRIEEGSVGILVKNNAVMNMNTLRLYSTSAVDYGIYVENSGRLNIHGFRVVNDSWYDNVCTVSSSNSKIEIDNFDCESINVSSCFNVVDSGQLTLKTFDIRNSISAISMNTSGYSHLLNGYIKDCTYGLIVSGNTTNSEIFSVACDDCTNDLMAFSGSTLIGTGNGFRNDRMSINGSTTTLTHISTQPGDEGFEIKGELHVGSPEQPQETVLGQGDSFVNGMLVYQGDVNGGYLDISTSAKSYEESTFSFSANSTDQCLYMASDLLRNGNYFGHLGVKSSVTTSALGTGFQIEYWNKLNSAWQPVNYMVTNSNSPYYPYDKSIEVPVGSYQIRYDNFELKSLRWGKNDPIGDGTDRYWIRWRITSAFSQMPEFEQLKLHSSRTEFNNDGWLEYFGRARPLATLPWSMTSLGKNTSMGNGDVFIGDNIFVNLSNNVWDTNGDKTGFASPIPLDCDTSTPINLCWAVRAEDNGTANWTVRWTYTSDGDVIYTAAGGAPTSAVNEKIITTSGTTVAGQQKWFNVRIDISDLRPRKQSGFPDILWASIERTTSTGNLRGFVLNPEYSRWCDGGHIDTNSD